jgi:hypothetical protein
MKTIFAKYNRERLPKYQIVTKIVVDEDGTKYALKEALCDEAKEHIENIYTNHELLKSSYDINLVKPTKLEKGLLFEMAEGKSLENILLESLDKNDEKEFNKYIDKFFSFLDGMVSRKNVEFIPSKEFEAIFGKWKISENQDIIKVANVDLIFGNIFVNEKDEFSLIDYEWVFDFAIPKNYVIWRSLSLFATYHSIDLTKLINCFDNVGNDNFFKHDNMFNNFVHGVNKKCFLPSAVGQIAKSIDFNIFNPIQFESQRIVILQKENYIQEQKERIELQRIVIEQKENYIQEKQQEINQIANNWIFKFFKKIKLIKVSNK